MTRKVAVLLAILCLVGVLTLTMSCARQNQSAIIDQDSTAEKAEEIVSSNDSLGDSEPEHSAINEDSGALETNTLKTEQTKTQEQEQALADVALADINVPILMYHTSSEDNPGTLAELYIKPSEFAKQLAWLKEAGYTFCTFDDWPNLNRINKPILLTFDDGYIENYTEIYPLLKQHQAKITIFLIADKKTGLTPEMIKEMSASKLVKFESHTLSHPSLVAISSDPNQLEAEIGESKATVEALSGKTVVALSYPNGEFNEQVKAVTKQHYLFGVRKDLGMHNTQYDNYEIHRIRINRSTTLSTYQALVQ